MPRVIEPAPEPSDVGGSRRERGVRTVKALNAVSAELQPLRQKVEAGQPLTKHELERYAQLEAQYRTLEGELRALLRPAAPEEEP